MQISNISHTVFCTNCLTGAREAIPLAVPAEIFNAITQTEVFFGPGLIDLQINGINGIDFNDINLQPDSVALAARHLLKRGVVTFFPTVITNSKNALLHILSVINKACEQYEICRKSIIGIHLEGPFISKKPGARGAHDSQYTCDPDWEYFQELQFASGNRIRLITLAPERKGSIKFIQKCKSEGIAVAIGHSLASSKNIVSAVRAGASMSTHLGNGVPLVLPRHNNILWEQLAQNGLFAGFIGDGFHLPCSFIKVLLRVKGGRAILVSDATRFTGMLPGQYRSNIGGIVELDDAGRLYIQQQPGLLAGSASDMLQAIEWLIENKVCSLQEAWACASENPAAYLGLPLNERVVFYIQNNRIHLLESKYQH